MRDLYHRSGRIASMVETTPGCPRCRASLRPVDLKGVGVHACATCHGTRLSGTRLALVLEALSAELLATFDPDTTLPPSATAPERLACADCGREMARDDYCGAGLALFDRCEPCALVWVDAEALGTMTLMWARMDTRRARDTAATKRLLDEADDFVVRGLVGRAVQRALFRGFS
jgi:Zn-finger nucleic acid-binding protein